MHLCAPALHRHCILAPSPLRRGDYEDQTESSAFGWNRSIDWCADDGIFRKFAIQPSTIHQLRITYEHVPTTGNTFCHSLCCPSYCCWAIPNCWYEVVHRAIEFYVKDSSRFVSLEGSGRRAEEEEECCFQGKLFKIQTVCNLKTIFYLVWCQAMSELSFYCTHHKISHRGIRISTKFVFISWVYLPL